MADSLRVLLASDLMLGRPMRGLTEWPEELTDELIEAPYNSVEALFARSQESSASFIILTGNVIDQHHCSPVAFRFLFDCCHRVAKHGVQVLWFEGKYDRFDEWPLGVQLPDNLTCIPSDAIKPIVRTGKKASSVRFSNVGLSSSNSPEGAMDIGLDLQAAECDFHIGISTDGRVDEAALDGSFDMIATGGRSSFREQSIAGVPAYAPGTPQPRRPGQDVEGCVLDVLLKSDRVSVNRIPTASVLFKTEQLELIAAPTLDSLKERLGERYLDMVASLEDRIGLVRWIVDVPAADFSEFNAESLEKELVEWLRSEFCNATHRLWTYRVEFRAEGATPTSWLEEDAILGDFLRALREYETDTEREIDLEQWMLTEARDVRDMLDEEIDETGRKRLLEKVREMGFQMLR